MENMADGMTGAMAEPRPGKAVGEDLRRRAVAAVLERGMSYRETAQKFEVCVTSVLRWVQRFRAHGDVRAYKRGGRDSRIEPHSERIFQLLEERPEISGRALQAALAGEGIVLGTSTVQRFLKRHGLDTRARLAARRG